MKHFNVNHIFFLKNYWSKHAHKEDKIFIEKY